MSFESRYQQHIDVASKPGYAARFRSYYGNFRRRWPGRSIYHLMRAAAGIDRPILYRGVSSPDALRIGKGSDDY